MLSGVEDLTTLFAGCTADWDSAKNADARTFQFVSMFSISDEYSSLMQFVGIDVDFARC